MSLTYGFYNSVNGDRKYNALQMSSLFDGIIRDGVFLSVGNAFGVAANGGMGVVINTGRAWFNHTWTNNDALLPLTVPASEVLLNRIDTVVLEIDQRDETRANSIKIVKGTPSATPVAPTLASGPLIYQYALAEIYVGAGVTVIAANKITNKVGTTNTPFVSGVVSAIDANALLTQWASDYNIWRTAIGNESGVIMSDIHNQLEALLAQADAEADAQLEANGVRFENWFSTLIAVLDENVAARLTAQVVALEDNAKLMEIASPELPLKASNFVPTYSSGKITGGITYVGGIKRKEEIITYTGDNVSGMTTKIYNVEGTVVTEQTTDSIVYTNSVITDFIRVVNL